MTDALIKGAAGRQRRREDLVCYFCRLLGGCIMSGGELRNEPHDPKIVLCGFRVACCAQPKIRDGLGLSAKLAIKLMKIHTRIVCCRPMHHTNARRLWVLSTAGMRKSYSCIVSTTMSTTSQACAQQKNGTHHTHTAAWRTRD